VPRLFVFRSILYISVTSPLHFRDTFVASRIAVPKLVIPRKTNEQAPLDSSYFVTVGDDFLCSGRSTG
jgi:hypothetical protein